MGSLLRLSKKLLKPSFSKCLFLGGSVTALWNLSHRSPRVLAEPIQFENKIDPNMMQKISEKYYLKGIGSAEEFFKNGVIQIIIVVGCVSR